MGREFLLLLATSVLIRIGFFCYGVFQDAHFEVKYTDIDYFVFHDAAGYVFEGLSPYNRDTYRYTPILSWLLLPNFYFNWLHTGKVLFVLFDILTGVMIMKVLTGVCSQRKQLILASIWLLNPIVITISTRGNAESLLCFLVMCAVYFLRRGSFVLAGLFYGLSIHFKIYPIIYATAIALYILLTSQRSSAMKRLFTVGISTVVGIMVPTYFMYVIYGDEFIENSYTYHFSRSDHRHNFSIWNLVLLLESAGVRLPGQVELSKIAFIPQLALCGILPYLIWQSPSFSNLLSVMFLQTYAFVTFNKVCTSQYFIWYIVLGPFYLANTTISYRRGVIYVIMWILSQTLWLSQAYLLEFKGQNVFYPNLFIGNVFFFVSNVYLLGAFIEDVKKRSNVSSDKKSL